MSVVASPVIARPAGFVRDLLTIAGRSLRAVPREPEFFVPALVVPVFFYFVNLGALEDIATAAGFPDYKAFELPVAIVIAVTGISRAAALVRDVESGYLDRLLVTPVRRSALLLGLMVADIAILLALMVPLLALGFALGVDFHSGGGGLAVFLLLGVAWGLAFCGFPYAIALRTGNPAAVNASFIVFLPFVFLTTSFLPESVLTGWFATITEFNPVTYVLSAMRSLLQTGWDAGALAEGIAALVLVAAVSLTLAFLALRGRVRRQ